MIKRLAIVIPAYKGDFIDEAIGSVARQTCKDFTLYIGNDAGSREIDKAVEKYKGDIDIVYKRFDENLGGKDLVAAWTRTLTLMGDEPFFELFSDDDIMEPDCVRRFYEELDKHPDYDVYHFNLSIINPKSEVRVCREGFPRVMSAKEFYLCAYVYGKYEARMPEFIFRTSKFKETGGFVDFPRAMCTDHATVMVVAKERGIYTIDGPKVWWRISAKQVSRGNATDRKLQVEYIEAGVLFDNWTYKREYFLSLPSKVKMKKRWKTLRAITTVDFVMTMNDRINMFFRSEMMKRYSYLVCIIPPLCLLKRMKRLFVTRKHYIG